MDDIVLDCEKALDALFKSETLSRHDVDQIKSKFLGKGSALTLLYKDMRTLDPAAKQTTGQKLNQLRESLQALIDSAYQKVDDLQIQKQLSETVDVTAQGRDKPQGALHPLTHAYNDVKEIFASMGFDVVHGPEIEDKYHNFEALNFPADHPAITMHDTFYLSEDELLLRTHTSTVQIHAMREHKPPFRIATPGKVYRCDHDATHSPMFNQVECLVVDEDCSFAQVKWLLVKFCETYLGQSLEYRFRPSFFPFTEPSAELDIRWHDKWLELAGCGMVHPNVLKEAGIDTDKYRGFAFGVGIDRLAMLKYGIKDLRVLYENHIDFLEQFS